MVILALLCPVPAAGAGLLDSSAQRHGFCGMQPAKTHRPQTRARSACMLCACKDGSTEAPLRILRVSAFVDIGIPIATSLALEKFVLCLIRSRQQFSVRHPPALCMSADSRLIVE